MTNRTPLAVFLYNRPLHTRRALDAISRLEGLEKIDLFIYSDAAKHLGHAESVREVRAIAQEFAARHPARIIEREQNYGLARSIAGSVTELTQAFGRVIVLEDDLVPTPDFLRFMLEGLDRYEADEHVLQISGCLLPGEVQQADGAFFLPLTTTWGWATWKRAWSLFRPLTLADRQLLDNDSDLRQRFNAEGSADYVAMLDDRLNGRNDSWGIFWWYAVAKERGLVLYPNRSLIWNGGFDASGVHCGGLEEFQAKAPLQFQRERLDWPVRMPESVEIDPKAWAAVLSFLNGDLPVSDNGVIEKLKHFVKSLLRQSRPAH